MNMKDETLGNLLLVFVGILVLTGIGWLVGIAVQFWTDHGEQIIAVIATPFAAAAASDSHLDVPGAIVLGAVIIAFAIVVCTMAVGQALRKDK